MYIFDMLLDIFDLVNSKNSMLVGISNMVLHTCTKCGLFITKITVLEGSPAVYIASFISALGGFGLLQKTNNVGRYVMYIFNMLSHICMVGIWFAAKIQYGS